MNKAEKLREMAYEFAAEICVNGKIDSDYSSEQTIELFSRAMQSYAEHYHEIKSKELVETVELALNDRDFFRGKLKESEARIEELEKAAYNAINYVGAANYAERIIKAKQMIKQTLTQEKDE